MVAESDAPRGRLTLRQTLDWLERDHLVSAEDVNALRRLALLTSDFGGKWPDLEALVRRLQARAAR